MALHLRFDAVIGGLKNRKKILFLLIRPVCHVICCHWSYFLGFSLVQISHWNILLVLTKNIFIGRFVINRIVIGPYIIAMFSFFGICIPSPLLAFFNADCWRGILVAPNTLALPTFILNFRLFVLNNNKMENNYMLVYSTT